MALYAAIQRDTRMLKDGYFWAGLALAVALMAGMRRCWDRYQHHFRIGKAIESTWNTGFIGKTGPATDGHPLYWYLGMMWADFSPGARCFRRRSCCSGPSARFVLIPRVAAARLGAGPLHGVQLGDTQTGSPI